MYYFEVYSGFYVGNKENKLINVKLIDNVIFNIQD